ncbi:MAG: carboxylating nicotinate-nucleotide diphosphorylase [Candidatus Anstonellaceae archaeon]
MRLEKFFLRKPSGKNAKKAALEALRQDASKDITSVFCIKRNERCRARIVAKSDFVLCGTFEANEIFSSKKVSCKWNSSEGDEVKKGQVVCQLYGNCRAILACERAALNFLMVLSGIATASRKAAQKYGKWKVAATRKTYPGLSDSCKRAVLVGGCLTHRLSLADGILVKDNHLAMIRKRMGRIEDAICVAISSFPKGKFVEVEVSSEKEAAFAAKCGADAILIDNVGWKRFSRIAMAARQENPKIIIEASGGITMRTAAKYFEAGADFVSTSKLILGAKPANLSLEIEEG